MGHVCPPGSGSGFRFRIRIQWPDWMWNQSRSGYGSGSANRIKSNPYLLESFPSPLASKSVKTTSRRWSERSTLATVLATCFIVLLSAQKHQASSEEDDITVQANHRTGSKEEVLRIHDILGRIRIRIRGSMPLTNGSGSWSWIRILLFSSLTFKTSAKN